MSEIDDAADAMHKKNDKKADAVIGIADKLEKALNNPEEIKKIISDLRFTASQIRSCGEGRYLGI